MSAARIQQLTEAQEKALQFTVSKG